MDAINSEPFRQRRSYLKRFVSYPVTAPAAFHFDLAELEAKIGENLIGIVPQNISIIHFNSGTVKS